MADLTILHVRVCASNIRYNKTVQGSKGNEYQVDFDYQHGWTCTCPAFQFHPDVHCKHIKAVEAGKCNWNQDAVSGSGDLNFHGDKCPECGGETDVVAIGV